MRYTFIAATIAGMAAVGTAQAMPSVRMYGIVDTTYEFASGKHVIYQNPTNTTSTISTIDDPCFEALEWWIAR